MKRKSVLEFSLLFFLFTKASPMALGSVSIQAVFLFLRFLCQELLLFPGIYNYLGNNQETCPEKLKVLVAGESHMSQVNIRVVMLTL